MNEMQNKWDLRWQDKAARAKWCPDPWLLKLRSKLTSGTVFDVACGMGRNSIYLAEQGFQVTGVDISPVALDALQAEACNRQLQVTTEQIDLEGQPQLPPGPFDLLLNFFYLYRPLLAQELSRVRPGGLAMVRTFSSAGEEQFGPLRPEIASRPGELVEIFSSWEVLAHEEGLEPSVKGGSLAGILARRPDIAGT